MTYAQRLREVRELIDEYFDIEERLETSQDNYINKLLMVRQEQIKDNLVEGIE